MDIPEKAFTPGEVEKLDPEGWKNVGMSIIDAFLVLKDH
jgi:hypothetical protein